MAFGIESSSPPVWQKITGTLFSSVVVVFLVFDGVIKLVPIQPVIDTLAALGYPVELARPLGVITLLCAVLYGIPKTSVLGAILLTALLGGAVATHVRVGSPLFSHVLFGVYLGLLAWGGLYLRSEVLRRLIPFRRGSL